jgi:hypothetical protein
VAAGLYLLVSVLGARAEDDGLALGLAVLALLAGVGLGACAWGLAVGRRWAGGPVLTWQLLQISVSIGVVTSRWWWLGVLLLLPAVAAGGLALRIGRGGAPTPPG